MLYINVSPLQLLSDSCVTTDAGTLDEFGIPGSALCLEITEGVVVLDFETTRNALAGLKDVGVHVAIDDFGTGFSGFTHLKSLPIDIVTIDRKIIRDLAIEAGDLAVVRAIMALADAFALEVVAEGVETAGAARTLLGLGCRRAQGFLLSRPLDDAAMASLRNASYRCSSRRHRTVGISLTAIVRRWIPQRFGEASPRPA